MLDYVIWQFNGHVNKITYNVAFRPDCANVHANLELRSRYMFEDTISCDASCVIMYSSTRVNWHYYAYKQGMEALHITVQRTLVLTHPQTSGT